jgi:hypothetical protein
MSMQKRFLGGGGDKGEIPGEFKKDLAFLSARANRYLLVNLRISGQRIWSSTITDLLIS